MRQKFRAAVREWVPPAIIRLYLNYLNTKYGFHGDYATWAEARRASGGYDAAAILQAVRPAALKVKRGEAAYERDSILYHELRFPWPILAALLRIAALNQGRLGVLDFGGSLGSTYFQCRPFLDSLSEFRWSVVEQRDFVRCGQQEFEDSRLRFYYDLEACWAAGPADVAMFSSVLPYLEKPYEVLEKVMSFNVRHILIDRHPLLISGERDRLTVQRVRPSIYKASYPAWFFNPRKFMDFIRPRYRLMAAFDCDVWCHIPCHWKGLILERL